jgi:hypothetical protein
MILARLLCLSSFLVHPGSATIPWRTSFDAATDAAKKENKVLFIAVNMDGEGANDRLARNVYTDKDVLAFAALTVDVIASQNEHAGADKDCPRFPGVKCAEHQACEMSVRKNVLEADPTGNVVAPQHVFLAPDGKPLLSVPYEITAPELEWCFVTAMHKLDPASKVAMPGGAHKPARVVLGAVYDPSGAVGGAIQPITKKELLGLIDQVKRGGMKEDDKQVAFWRILHSDLPEAMAFIQAELRSGGGGDPNGDGGGQKHRDILHAMGAVSPPAYWEMAVDGIAPGDDKVRLEAIAALEQMAPPQAVKALEKSLSKEKKPEIQKDLVRALAACGSADPRVRATIVKRVKSEKNELVRVNAIVALGLVEQDADVVACLKEILTGKDGAQRAAAACAAGLSRDDAWIPLLEPLTSAGGNTSVVDTATRALEVLRGGPIQRLQMSVWTICKDTVTRERTFGRSES